MEEEKKEFSQSIFINDRKRCKVDGVKKVDSFDSKEFLVETTLGFLHIQGKDLSLGTMNMDKGTLVIEGRIDACRYLDKDNKDKKESLLKKLFK